MLQFVTMLRRTFLQAASTAALAAASPVSYAAEGIRLGFDSFSIRAFEWKAIQMLDYAAGLKLDTVNLSSLGDYENLEPAYLQRVRDHAARLGLEIDAGVGSVCPSSKSYDKRQGDAVEYVRKGLRVGHAVGSRVMRCFLGNAADRRDIVPIEAHMENTIKVFRAVRSEALDLGVRIALENHAGDLQAREVKTIVEEAGKDFVGVCLDTGNAITALEDPVLTLEVLGPYTLTTHVRDAAVYEHPRGAVVQFVALGDGSVDLPRFAQLYRQLCPNAAIQLEILTGRKPEVFPYLDADFWKPFPKTPAAEFVRFVAMAKRGRPFVGNMVIAEGRPGPILSAALKEQQMADLERSLEYAKKTLDFGIRWRQPG